MKLHSFYNTIILTVILSASGILASCDDFLTVLPDDSTTEEHFWESKEDLLNVRAGAYKQLANIGSKIIYWGELRSDNVKLHTLSNNELLFLQQAILRPTNSNYDWAAIYKGISYCNLILSKGTEMTTEPLVDPAFSRNDFNQYAADITALRALYYFYLVRAFRDVPYVVNTVKSDEEAMKLYIPVSSGEAILGEMCKQLEENVDKAFVEESFSSPSERKGYFTQTAIHALLADMYLWRGCMLKNYSKKRDAAGHVRMLNIDDHMVVSESGDTTFTTVDGVELSDTYANEQSNICFQAAVDHANEVLKIQMRRYYESYQRASEMTRNVYEINSEFKINNYSGGGVYPLYKSTIKSGNTRTADDLYSRLWSNNGNESIFEIQFDRTNTSASLYSVFGSYSSGQLNIGTWVVSDFLVSGAANKKSAAEQGLGKTDLRTLQTMGYTTENLAAAAVPIHKNLAQDYIIMEVNDMSKGFAHRVIYKSTMDGNWPIYRLTDVMLIKAEALTRLGQSSGYDEANYLVNHIYARNCPSMAAADTTKVTDQTGLLKKVYSERQREFVGEGKRWFDIVRQAEAGDYYSDRLVTIMESMASFIAVTNVVKNRLRSLWSFYSPIVDDEIRVQGVQAGGQLYQNPVWERYSSIK